MKKSFIWKSSPPKGVKIRKTKKPQEGHPLSGVVLLHVEGGGVETYNVKFNNLLVEELGKVMPMGLGEAHPAFLHVVEKYGMFEVRAEYLYDGVIVYLWVQDSLPEWCIK